MGAPCAMRALIEALAPSKLEEMGARPVSNIM